MTLVNAVGFHGGNEEGAEEQAIMFTQDDYRRGSIAVGNVSDIGVEVHEDLYRFTGNHVTLQADANVSIAWQEYTDYKFLNLFCISTDRRWKQT